jgi:hypothetical protein
MENVVSQKVLRPVEIEKLERREYAARTIEKVVARWFNKFTQEDPYGVVPVLFLYEDMPEVSKGSIGHALGRLIKVQNGLHAGTTFHETEDRLPFLLERVSISLEPWRGAAFEGVRLKKGVRVASPRRRSPYENVVPERERWLWVRDDERYREYVRMKPIREVERIRKSKEGKQRSAKLDRTFWIPD